MVGERESESVAEPEGEKLNEDVDDALYVLLWLKDTDTVGDAEKEALDVVHTETVVEPGSDGAEDAVSVFGSSASVESTDDFTPLFVAITSHDKPLSTEMKTRALSRIVLLFRSPCAFWVSRK